MKKNAMTATELVEKGTNCLITDYGFFATMLLQLNIEVDNNQPTMCTDGENLYYNEKFVETLSLGEVCFVLLHEVMHCAMGHMWRRNDRIFPLWNIATDYAVNGLINQVATELYHQNKQAFGNLAFEIIMPKEALYNEKYLNKSAEEIYDEIKKNAKIINISTSGNSSDGKQQDGSGNGNSNGKDGKNNNAGNGTVVQINNKEKVKAPTNHDKWGKADKQSDSKKQQKASEWDSKLISANEQLKNRGVTPAGLERIIGKIINPQKDWRLLLQEFVQEEVNDYSLMPPDKRYDGDFFMFDFNDTTEVVKDVLFFVDTSGSMGNEEINLCYSEIQGAINQFHKNLHGTLLFFDADVDEKTYDFDDVNGDISHIKPMGGGGTSYDCIFKYINNNRDKFVDINGVIILTDGYCDYPKEEITNNIPVLWVYTTKDNKPPFGRSTELTIK